MSEKKMPTQVPGNVLQHNLKHLVGFGSEPSAPQASPANVTERLKELVRKVEDLNRRVDRLKDQF